MSTGSPSVTCTAITYGWPSRVATQRGSIRVQGSRWWAARASQARSVVEASTSSPASTAITVSAATLTWCPCQSQYSVAIPYACASSSSDSSSSLTGAILPQTARGGTGDGQAATRAFRARMNDRTPTAT